MINNYLWICYKLEGIQKHMDTIHSDQTLSFRKATSEDLEFIWTIINQAKAQMERLGSTQWSKEYPAIETIEADIAREEGYVLCRNGEILTYGVVSFAGEAAYDTIDGKWSNDLPYLIVHRLAVAEHCKKQGLALQFMLQAEEIARAKGISNFRVDTKYDNAYMLRLIDKMGFRYSGDVVYRADQHRKAFEKTIVPHTHAFGKEGYLLQEITWDDVVPIFNVIDAYRTDLSEWLPFVVKIEKPDDEAIFVNQILMSDYESRPLVFKIKYENQICGLIGFPVMDKANRRAEIGYWLVPPFRGKGIITNAVRYLCEWAFCKSDMNRIQIRCGVNNKASSAIPKNLGFVLEGTERDGELMASGDFIDIQVYSLLKKDLLKSGSCYLSDTEAKEEQHPRKGWAEAFAAYACEGEDEKMLPDHFDNETDKHL